jgi:hypothetical protein
MNAAPADVLRNRRREKSPACRVFVMLAFPH